MRLSTSPKNHRISFFICGIIAVTILLCLLGKNQYAESIVFWGSIILFFYGFRPSSRIHRADLTSVSPRTKRITAVTVFCVILLVTLPMSLSPFWNGTIPEHRNQYELLAESIINGHVYLDYDEDNSALDSLENPYDPELREELGISYHYDHAYYNGHYYVYFGVVPVILLFLPFRLITGMSLTTYHATQIFAAFTIIGFFALFLRIARRYFPKLSFCAYLSLASAFSVMSIWYSIGTPALYCTAILSGVCLQIWSIYFFFCAFYLPETRHTTLFIFIGALCGALVFGCRPPVALGNLLLLPMLVHYCRGRKWDLSLLKKIAAVILPYLIVGLLLMYYNEMRFDSPFEFGQTYQLTLADQHMYGTFRENFNFSKELGALISNFAGISATKDAFPYISYGGAFVNFPILLLLLGFLFEPIAANLKQKGILELVGCLLFLPILVTLVDAYWSPFIAERYRMDIYYLMAIACFISIGLWSSTLSSKGYERFSSFICNMCLFTLFICLLLFLVAHDYNPAEYNENIPLFFKHLLFFGH